MNTFKLGYTKSKYFPMLRWGQVFSNFEKWLIEYKEKDIFYVEDEELPDLLEEFGEYETNRIKNKNMIIK